MFIADTHCDTIGYVLRDSCKFKDLHNAPANMSRLQVYAMFCEFPWDACLKTYGPSAEKEGVELKNGKDLLRLFIKKYYECVSNEEGLFHCNDANEAVAALKKGSGALLSVEGCGCVDCLEELEKLYRAGVRFVGLTWNYNNILGCGAPVSGTGEDTGLTEYGKEFIQECERLGIVIDISHASDKTVDDVLMITKRPIIASHSNFRELCRHNRNLKAEHSDEIVRRGGYIGLNLYYSFVDETVTHDTYYKNMIIPHIEYAIKRGYDDNVGFGFDIDGVSWEYPKDISLKRSIHEQYLELFEQTGMQKEFISRLAGENFLNFFKRYCTK